MKFSYRLKRVCGSVYDNGNVVFTPDGNSVISPVGNRLNMFDLVNQTSEALPIENRKNVYRIAMSHNGQFLLSIDEEGCAQFFNFPKKILLHSFNFRQKVFDVKFSPDDKYFSITYGHGCQIWKSPSAVREFCPLTLVKTIVGHYDDSNCLDWSGDSQSIIIGSRDLTARVFYRAVHKNTALSILAGHRDEIVGVYFGQDPNVAYTIAVDGGVFTWKFENPTSPANDKDSDDDSENDSEDDSVFIAHASENKNKNVVHSNSMLQRNGGKWELSERQLLRDHQGEITCTAFNISHSILVLGFSNGVFGLYEMPGCVNIHRISVGNNSLSSVSLNTSGEWLAVGCANLGQLLIWEWKSESYILKQQGHLYGMNVLDFSSEGQYVVSGGEDGKVKLWNTLSGFCIITFKDHLAPVTGVKFIGQGQGKAIITCSLDGTIRAYDLLRYKNFRTLTTPTPVQFTSLTADHMGEIVCAGSMDPFNIYVWSLQTGKMLEVLSGHEGPISCLDFHSSSSMLASGSWDGTLKLWNVYQNQCVETLEHGCDILSVAFRADGKEIACSTTNGNINIWDVENGEQTSIIEGRRDLFGGRLTTDRISNENALKSKFFTSITYSSDGTCILAGGKSKYVCIYSISTSVLVKKFQLSHNKSLEGVLDKLRSDRLVDGVSLDNLTETDDSKHGNSINKYASKSKLSDSNRTVRSELMTLDLQFSPTGHEFAVATTQGLQIFCLDDELLFVPLELDVEITPQTVDFTISQENYSKALLMSVFLGDKGMIQKVLESVKIENIQLVVRSLGEIKVLKEVLKFVTEAINTSLKLEFYLSWALSILQEHGKLIQINQSNLSLIETLRGMLRALLVHEKEIYRVTTDNMFMLEFIMSQLNLTDQNSLSQIENEPLLDEPETVDDLKNSECGIVNDEEDFDGEWSNQGEWNSAWVDQEDKLENIGKDNNSIEVVDKKLRKKPKF